MRYALGELEGNKTQVAARLNMSRSTVIKRLQVHGLE